MRKHLIGCIVAAACAVGTNDAQAQLIDPSDVVEDVVIVPDAVDDTADNADDQSSNDTESNPFAFDTLSLDMSGSFAAHNEGDGDPQGSLALTWLAKRWERIAFGGTVFYDGSRDDRDDGFTLTRRKQHTGGIGATFSYGHVNTNGQLTFTLGWAYRGDRREIAETSYDASDNSHLLFANVELSYLTTSNVVNVVRVVANATFDMQSDHDATLAGRTLFSDEEEPYDDNAFEVVAMLYTGTFWGWSRFGIVVGGSYTDNEHAARGTLGTTWRMQFTSNIASEFTLAWHPEDGVRRFSATFTFLSLRY